ncbi:glycoside hydrolase domain-containing protein [Polyangium fumosum]|nr:glycoside hydrolase domain-containing protein [Polyangium fumosum]
MPRFRFALLVLPLFACGSPDGPPGGNGKPPLPPCTDCTPSGDRAFVLPSPAGATLWTATPMDKILREATPPSSTGDGIHISAAKNELEPFQIVVRPDAAGKTSITLTPFTGPGTLDDVRMHRVGYVHITEPSDPASIVSPYVPDPLHPTAFGASHDLAAGENQPFWITVRVPPGAAAGDYTATLTVTTAGATQDIPVTLHVYDFELPAKLGFDGNWNTSFEALGGSESLEKVRALKDFFYEHRLVPGSVAWPAGLNYNGGIEYDCATGSFLEENNPYDFSQLGPAYIDGAGWNGVGFPSFQIMQFVDNVRPRPQTFCGKDRGQDAFGTPEYNAEWSKLLAAIDAYLVAKGWQDKGYYYVQNEPQGPEDYAVAAFLAELAKKAAPNLRLAISEEPKPEIAEHASIGSGHYDLWWADLSHFDPAYAKTRQALGETVWWYFLYGDLPPHFNPITIDHPGIETRIAHWAAWKYRIRGFAYYSVTGWGSDPYQNPRPQGTKQNGDGFLLYPPEDGALVSSIRWELLREGAEDFEYLLRAAGGTMPKTPEEATGCDLSAASAVSSPTSYTRDASALAHLRDQLGLYLEGKVNGCPALDSTPEGAHPRAAYYINFQDPNGQPAANPLVVDGHEWIKVGWEAYEAKRGYGWSGPYIGDPGIMLYKYLTNAPVSELQKSVIYNDYGRTDTFNWDIAKGKYEVTVSIGWHDGTYEKNRVVVEGQTLFDAVATTPATPYRVASVVVDVNDGNVTMEAGQQDEYTMLNWMSIVPVP